jgi:hypothetical protein
LASRLPTPEGLTAAWVSLVMSISMTLKGSRSWPSSGLLVVAGLLQVALTEGGGVDDQRAGRAEIGEVDLEGGRVERHQYVELVARGPDPPAAELDLEGRNAEGGADRRPDLGRKIRERREIGAAQGGFLGEAAAGQLHAVAAVAGKAHDERHAGRGLASARLPASPGSRAPAAASRSSLPSASGPW